MAIASCLVDTNILLRMTRKPDPQHKIVADSLALLAGQRTSLYYAHQNIAELWNCMTRPASRNGLGLSVHEAEREVQASESGMTLLADGQAVYREWRTLVTQYAISGVQVHDARLVAAMRVHRVAIILTLNVSDFARFTDVTALHPSDI